MFTSDRICIINTSYFVTTSSQNHGRLAAGVTITELLTSKRSQLLSKCIEKIPFDPMPRAIWTDNGRILVKLGNNRPFLIKTNDDLDKLLREIPQYIANFGNSAPV